MHTIWSLVRDNLIKAQEHQRRYYDEGRRVVTYDVGTLVMLNVIKRPLEKQVKKLRVIWYGPYRVIQKVGELTYRLAPAADGVNPRYVTALIHVARLKKFRTIPEELRPLNDAEAQPILPKGVFSHFQQSNYQLTTSVIVYSLLQKVFVFSCRFL